MKNVIIFGAGASKGSDTTTATPPLTKDLFYHLKKFDPVRWEQIDGQLQKILESDFEEGMRRIDSYKLPDLLRSMVIFFYNYKSTTSNLYLKFIQEVIRHKIEVSIVTLNYDRLLEQCLNYSDARGVVNKTKSNSEIEICFPHGCCNFFCVSVKSVSGGVFFDARNVSASGDVIIARSVDEFRHRIENEAFPPVMSNFEPSKITTSGRNFILDQRQRYKALVNDAEKIVIVGIKLREHDKHLWEPLAQSKAEIMYCSGANEVAAMKSWIEQHQKNPDNILPTFWDESFGKIVDFIL